MSEQRKTITAKEAAQRLGVDSSSIARYVRRGSLEGYKLDPNASNSHLRIYEDSVEKLLKARAGL